VRNVVKAAVARGHFQIHVAFTRTPGDGAAPLNRPLLDAWLSAFREAAERYGVDSEPDLNAALRLPGMLGSTVAEELGAAVEEAVLEVAREAVAALNTERAREGAVMAEEIRERCEAIANLAARIEEIRENATEAFQKRLQDRLAELLKGAAI